MGEKLTVTCVVLDDVGVLEKQSAKTAELAEQQILTAVDEVRRLVEHLPPASDEWQALTGAAQQLHSASRAKGAAKALTAVRETRIRLQTCCQPGAREAVQQLKDAERAVREVVVWRCLATVDPGNRREFMAALPAAFGVAELDTDLQAQLLLSHRKVASSVIQTFPNSGPAVPQPRRRRPTGP